MTAVTPENAYILPKGMQRLAITEQNLIIVRQDVSILIEERVRNALCLQDCFVTYEGEGEVYPDTLRRCLGNLSELASGYKCWCHLMTDFAPFSFFWSLVDMELKSPLHGGLIFHRNRNWQKTGRLGEWSLHT